jgi:DNA mismatch endonuclease (patch repair protein)
MAAIRATGNKATEVTLAAILRANRITGWRRNQRVVGKPDFLFRRERVAVFVDGCFWHGCLQHCRMPKSRQDFWEPKIAKNKLRDLAVARILRRARWAVVRVWEHELARPEKVLPKLGRSLHQQEDFTKHE